MRSGILLLAGAISAGAVLAGPAQARGAPIVVTYNDAGAGHALVMNRAIDQALKNPAFVRRKKPAPGIIVLTVPQGQHDADGSSTDSIRFTLVFTRNNTRIGNSVEICAVEPPFNCAKQIASDIKTAAAIARQQSLF